MAFWVDVEKISYPFLFGEKALGVAILGRQTVSEKNFDKMGDKSIDKPSGKFSEKTVDPVLQNEIPDKVFFKIGEVSELTSVMPYVLRYWETEFSIIPHKSPSGQRLYRRKDIERVLIIKHLLYSDGFTIAGARKHLLKNGQKKIEDDIYHEKYEVTDDDVALNSNSALLRQIEESDVNSSDTANKATILAHEVINKQGKRSFEKTISLEDWNINQAKIILEELKQMVYNAKKWTPS